MKNIYLIGLIVTILCVTSWIVYGQNPTKKHTAWEYKTLYTNATGFQWDMTFNELGASGWELVAATNNESGAGAYYTFKRAK